MSVKAAEITVLGMSCQGCAARVEKAIRENVPGVETVKVDLAGRKAAVDYDSERADLKKIAAAVEAAGYKPVLD